MNTKKSELEKCLDSNEQFTPETSEIDSLRENKF